MTTTVPTWRTQELIGRSAWEMAQWLDAQGLPEIAAQFCTPDSDITLAWQSQDAQVQRKIVELLEDLLPAA